MITNTQVFNLSTIGSYPFEKYVAQPITFDVGDLPEDFTSIFWSRLDGSGVAVPSGGSLITRTYVNFYKNPLIQVLSYLNPYYNNFIYYDNATYNRFSNKFITNVPNLCAGYFQEKVSVITLNNTFSETSNLTLDISSIRQNFKTPYEFYFFYIQLNDITKNSYGYVLYPNKIFLEPKGISYDGDKWSLVTSVKILNTETIHIQSEYIERDFLNLHIDRLKNIPTNITSIPENLSENKIYFELLGSKTKLGESTVQTSTLTNPPSAYSLSLQNNIADINLDSTFIAFSSIYINNSNISETLAQQIKNDSYLYESQTFDSTCIVDYNPTNKIQTYQLLQSRLNQNLDLGNSLNCVLSADFNLNTGFFNFYNSYKKANVKFFPNTPLKIDYIADSYYFSSTAVSSTLINNGDLFVYDGVTELYSQSISNPFIVNNISSYDVVWKTTYPPYHYSYKLTLNNSSDAYLDSNKLIFYLKLTTIYQDTNSVKLSAHIISDFNHLSMPIDYNDLISFKIESTSLENDDEFINNVICSYGDSISQIPYDIKNSPSISVLNDQYLTINYNNLLFQGVQFNVKASVTTPNNILDTFNAESVSVTPPNLDSSSKIFIEILYETSNEITIDASLNTSEIEWPSRDLTDSKILWFYGDNSDDLSLFYVDLSGNYIRAVTGEDVFSKDTWTIKLSGYGPIKTSISLSSQKYDEIAKIYTNPNLYDFLSQGKLKVGVLKQLNNLNRTRTIELTAAIPYGDRLFNIPSTIPINWIWQYDDIEDPEYQPIEIKQTLNNNEDYLYGNNLVSTMASAIRVNVTPEYSKVLQKIHKVKVTANIDVTQPSITGSYTFKVDDFPDPSIFNCDFVTYYTNFQSNTDYTIANTRNNKNIITRSENSFLNLTFSAYNDIIRNIKNLNLNWTFDDIISKQNSDVYNIELTNPLSGLIAKTLSNLTVSSCDIGLNIYYGYAPGWTSAHNVSASTYIYILSSIDFYQQLNFIVYPEFAWLGDNGNYTLLTLLSTDPNEPSYFTNAYAPTAYFYKKSNSQTFWVSANKMYFDDYIYQNKQNYTIASTPSAYDLLDISYDELNPNIAKGIPITLIAYNSSFYPENINLNYLDEVITLIDEQDSIIDITPNTYFVSNYYKITSETLNQNPNNEIVYNNFFLTPKFNFYNDALLIYDPYCNDQLTTTLNLDVTGKGAKISVMQYLNTSPLYQPAMITGGTITYYLSTMYWTASSVVSVKSQNVSTYHDLFFVKYGDPSIPLYAGESGKEPLYFFTETNLIQKIPYTTFDKYLYTDQYPKDADLWNEITL
jgi:hypothetical protein